MQPLKIIARYLDGTILKGTTHNFQTTGAPFHLLPSGYGSSAKPTVVDIKKVKAIFFVDNFEGKPAYQERKKFNHSDTPQGRRVEIKFIDGESLAGAVSQYSPLALGFFLFPVDRDSNNQKVFVVNSSVKDVIFLDGRETGGSAQSKPVSRLQAR